ncbi:MAG: recombinase family protein [Thermoplasmata archaeon]|nr:recombinase family protein [Thermoplasmata archaeon]
MSRGRVAAYIRVSTEEQAREGYSLAAQKQALEDYCSYTGYEIVKFYIDDGYSGRNTRRPAYRQMLEDIDTWDSILVLKMDRIHRNSRNFLEMMDLLKKKNKEFISKQEKWDTNTAMGTFVIQLLQSVAQLESGQIGERTKDGMRQKAETLENNDDEKRTMGFTPPFGYRISEGKLVDDMDEQYVVSLIFELYAQDETMDSISYSLNRQGLLTRKGNPWNKYNLRNILHNPVYAGYMRWDDLLIRHDATPVVSPETFNGIQDKMAKKVRDPAKRNPEYVPVYDEVEGIPPSDSKLDPSEDGD